MRKYKIVKCYPGSPELGMELSSKNEDKNGFYWNHTWFNPVNYPEFWEEVKEKTYKILEFGFKNGHNRRLNDKGFYTRVDQQEERGLDLDVLLAGLSSTGYYIFSVERLLDGKVFSIGDKVYETITNKKDSWTIKEFSLKDERCFSCGINIENFEHKKEPLFITEDGFEVIETTPLYAVLLDIRISRADWYNPKMVEYREGQSINFQNYKWFKSEENAKNWIKENKPQYSEKQIVNILRGFDKEISEIEELKDESYLQYINKYK